MLQARATTPIDGTVSVPTKKATRRSIGSRPGTDSLGSARAMLGAKIAIPTAQESENIRRAVAARSRDVEDYKVLISALGFEPQRGGDVLWLR